MYFRELPVSYGDDSEPFRSGTLGVYEWTKQRVAQGPGLMVDALAGPDTVDAVTTTSLLRLFVMARSQGGQS